MTRNEVGGMLQTRRISISEIAAPLPGLSQRNPILPAGLLPPQAAYNLQNSLAALFRTLPQQYFLK
jgi:hypothetical protein